MTERGVEQGSRQIIERALLPRTAVKIDGVYGVRFSRTKRKTYSGNNAHTDRIKIITPRDTRVSVRRREGLWGEVRVNFTREGIKFTNFPLPKNGILPIVDIGDLTVDLKWGTVTVGEKILKGLMLKINTPEEMDVEEVTEKGSGELSREILVEHEERAGTGIA